MNRTILLFTVENYSKPQNYLTGGMLRINSFLEYFSANGFKTVIALEANEDATNSKYTWKDEEYEIVYFTLNKINRFISQYSPDLIFCEQWFFLPYIESKLAPVIVDLHGSLVFENYYRSDTGLYKDMLAKIKAFKNCDLVIVPNDRQRAYFIAWMTLSGFKPGNIDIITVPVFF